MVIRKHQLVMDLVITEIVLCSVTVLLQLQAVGTSTRDGNQTIFTRNFYLGHSVYTEFIVAVLCLERRQKHPRTKPAK